MEKRKKKERKNSLSLTPLPLKSSGKHLLVVLTMGKSWYFWGFSCFYFCISLSLHFHRHEQHKRPRKCVSCFVSFSERTPPASFLTALCPKASVFFLLGCLRHNNPSAGLGTTWPSLGIPVQEIMSQPEAPSIWFYRWNFICFSGKRIKHPKIKIWL